MEDATEWFNNDSSHEDLIRELLDNESPFFVIPHTFQSPSLENPLASEVHSEPTTEYSESELSETSISNETTNQSHLFHARISVLEEKVMSKIDNKYTLKIKSCGAEMSDDGYKWRKYGQKSIKNSPHPRSYYRCTNPRCSAKKQVEKSSQDPDTLIITYEGLHLHFTYTHFLLNQPDSQPILPPTKKSKTVSKQAQTPQTHEIEEDQTQQIQENQEDQSNEVPLLFDPAPPSADMFGHQQELWEPGSQGLLEDMVPLMLRRPSNTASSPLSTTTFSNPSPNSTSYPSSPPTSSSSSQTWSPNYSSNAW
ncbi:WRKY Transcription Factor [Ranunculus cassubicifolius]